VRAAAEHAAVRAATEHAAVRAATEHAMERASRGLRGEGCVRGHHQAHSREGAVNQREEASAAERGSTEHRADGEDAVNKRMDASIDNREEAAAGKRMEASACLCGEATAAERADACAQRGGVYVSASMGVRHRRAHRGMSAARRGVLHLPDFLSG
jgi:hypothetical protein